MWGSTEKMARAIYRGLTEEGVPTKLYRLTGSDKSDIVKELLEARGLLLGSPTLNNGIFPTVAEFSAYIKGLRPKGRIAAVFGSYGWGMGATKTLAEDLKAAGMEGATKTLAEDLKAAGMEVVEDLQVKFVPIGEKLDKCEGLGRRVAQMIQAS
jgi:flavorubredoxin